MEMECILNSFIAFFTEKTQQSEQDGAPRDDVRVRRSSEPTTASSEHWVEVAMVADHTMLEYHGARELEAYLFTLMNMVSCKINFLNIGITALQLCYIV